ncbi:hypothetical protein [Pedobacter xixiisoli]|uniref:Uncharacterized protein n=1 Tax=Pedobacter xixiisoli TaxID=1476464 RepID=A0A285ZNF5_9SPHI|nr:hypothetical protein [Pedobacter xixiisoli]SOD11191.1 hypothetical protein SAMN06297358_0026 [Pedobacter xixiisoli]
MDLQQEWKNMSAEILTAPQNELISKFKLDGQSKDLLQDLIFKLKWKLRWVRIIDLPILAIALFSDRDLKILLIGVFALYEVSRWFGAREFQKIKTVVDYTCSTKEVLDNNLSAITKILAIENIWGYITAPLTGPIGFLCYKLTVHQSFANVFELPNIYLHLGLLIPLGILVIVLGNLMNRSIFKRQIENLKVKISEFSDDVTT